MLSIYVNWKQYQLYTPSVQRPAWRWPYNWAETCSWNYNLILTNTIQSCLCLYYIYFSSVLRIICGPGSSVGIATKLQAGRSGIESRWGRDIPPVQTGPGAHPASCKMGTGCFPGVKYGQGLLLTTHPRLVPGSWKSRAITLPTLWATPGL